MDELQAQQWAKGTIRGELDKRGLTYADLARKLNELGYDENERNLRNKIARGTFSATFFCACLEVIGVKTLHLDLLQFLRSTARVQLTGEPEYDEERGWFVRMKWWHDEPRGHPDVILLPSDEYPERSADMRFLCGYCGIALLSGWTMDEVRTQFRGENVIGRCGNCRNYNELPGAALIVRPIPGVTES
jgi:hypothetical protein